MKTDKKSLIKSRTLVRFRNPQYSSEMYTDPITVTIVTNTTKIIGAPARAAGTN